MGVDVVRGDATQHPKQCVKLTHCDHPGSKCTHHRCNEFGASLSTPFVILLQGLDLLDLCPGLMILRGHQHTHEQQQEQQEMSKGGGEVEMGRWPQ